MATYKPPKKQVSTYTKGKYTSPRRVSHYAGKKTFGEKIKNFFTIPEEDLKEEECKKKFDTYKLFTITRANLFIGILVFMLLINMLITFDVNFLYLRQILGFIFLITIPGLLIMLCFKIRDTGFWEYLVYTIGLSVAFIMFAGLAVNWTLPALGITDKPLSLWPILICFNIFLLALWVTAINRNHDFKPKPFLLPKLDAINNLFFIIPMFFPILSILGAFLLNNHGPNILTMIMLGGIAVYVLLIVLFRKRLNKNIYPWAILMISLAILMSGWMRSWFVSGVDINLEYSLFQRVQNSGVWTLYHLENNYDAMLSITILPTILSLFIKVNSQFILKLLLPFIFSFLPIIIYIISKRYFNNAICFLSSLFFMSQYCFFTWMAIPIRQEIAFLFFGLMLLVLFTKDLKPAIKKALFVIFGASMIVSHYSTSYISLALFTLTYLFILIYKISEKKKIKKGKINESQKSEFYITGILVLLLLIFGFLWYSQVTPTANGLVDFASKSVSSLGKIFNNEVQAEGQSFLEQFRLFNDKKDYSSRFKEYTEEYSKEIISKDPKVNFYDKSEYIDYKANLKASKLLPTKTNFKIISIISNIKELFGFIMGKILIILGFLFLYLSFKRNKESLEFLMIMFSFLLLLCLIVIMPFITINYELSRAYQQVLVLLSIPAILGILFLFKFFDKKYRIFYVSILVVMYFLLFSGFIYQLTGGKESSMVLNNIGSEYNMYFSHRLEIYSGYWILKDNFSKNINIDNRGASKLYLSSLQMNYYRDVLPSIIGRKNYVYSSYVNTNEQIAFKSFNTLLFQFNFPTEFLNDNKNKIYNNGGSEIFK